MTRAGERRRHPQRCSRSRREAGVQPLRPHEHGRNVRPRCRAPCDRGGRAARVGARDPLQADEARGRAACARARRRRRREPDDAGRRGRQQADADGAHDRRRGHGAASAATSRTTGPQRRRRARRRPRARARARARGARASAICSAASICRSRTCSPRSHASRDVRRPRLRVPYAVAEMAAAARHREPRRGALGPAAHVFLLGEGPRVDSATNRARSSPRSPGPSPRRSRKGGA